MTRYWTSLALCTLLGTAALAQDSVLPPPPASYEETGTLPDKSTNEVREARTPVGIPAFITPDAETQTPTDAETVAAIETYLQGVTTLRANFILVAPNFQTSHGEFSLQKPGKLRFEYDPPDQLLVVSDGKVITLVDYELPQVTRWPIKKTPLRPLVRSGTVFGDDVTIQGVRTYATQIRVAIAEAGDEDEGSMELVFWRDPLRLEGWEIVDAGGKRTIIALENLETDVTLDDSLWEFEDPRPQRRNRPGKR